MKTVRDGVSVVVTLALLVGYLCSQYAYANGRASEYAAAVDGPGFRIAAALVLVVAIVFSFVRTSESEEK